MSNEFRGIDVRAYHDFELAKLKSKIEKNILYSRGVLSNTLVVIQVGEDDASNSYIAGKKKDCEAIGINMTLVRVNPAVADTEMIVEIIEKWAHNYGTVGIIVQLPIPNKYYLHRIKNAIPSRLDVDGFRSNSTLKPCTPKGIIDYLDFCGYPLEGKNALVVGRSNLVGKPLAQMLLDKNATVTVAHSKTYENSLEWFVSQADIVFLAVDKIQYFNTDSIFGFSSNTPDVIDITLGRGEDGKLHGSLTDDAIDYIRGNEHEVISGTGGVGLLTRLALMKNVCAVMNVYI